MKSYWLDYALRPWGLLLLRRHEHKLLSPGTHYTGGRENLLLYHPIWYCIRPSDTWSCHVYSTHPSENKENHRVLPPTEP